MTATLAALLVLTLLVLLHEGAHYLLARRHHVRVDTFSLGIGPRLFGFTRGGTDFRLSLLPVGGYVRLAGSGWLADSDPQPGGFRSLNRWARVQILLAGPLANIAVGIALAASVAVASPSPAEDEGPGVVSLVLPGTAAARAGFLTGDRITGAAGACAFSFADVRALFDAAEPGLVPVEIERLGESITLDVLREAGPAGSFQELGLVVRIEPADAKAASPEPPPPLTARALDGAGDLAAAAAGVTQATWRAAVETPAVARDALAAGRPEAVFIGPIGITRLGAQAASADLATLLSFAAVVSIGLGLMNLLPIPVTDGGQICLLTLEAIAGRDAGPRVRMACGIAGLVMLGGLVILATVTDLRT